MIKYFILLIALVNLLSCQTAKEVDKDLFKQSVFYKAITSDSKDELKKKELKRITFSAKGLTVEDFSVWFSNTFSKGIVFHEVLRIKKISAEFVEATEPEIISLVSKMFNMESNRLGNTYYIGEFKQEDRGVLVRHVYGQSVKDIIRIINSVSADKGSSTVTNAGVVIMVDRESILTRVNNLLDTLSGIDIKKYVVNFYFITLDVSELEQKGVDMTTSGTFSADMAISSFTGLDTGLRHLANFNISGYVDYLHNNNFGKLSSTPLFISYDNIDTTIGRGEVVPFPVRNISPEGTVTTTYDKLEVGEDLRCLVRDAGRDKVILKLNYRNSEVISFINNEVPRTRKSVFNTSAVMETNKLYLMGEMINRENRESSKSFYKKTEIKNTKTQVFCRVRQI